MRFVPLIIAAAFLATLHLSSRGGKGLGSSQGGGGSGTRHQSQRKPRFTMARNLLNLHSLTREGRGMAANRALDPTIGIDGGIKRGAMKLRIPLPSLRPKRQPVESDLAEKDQRASASSPSKRTKSKISHGPIEATGWTRVEDAPLFPPPKAMVEVADDFRSVFQNVDPYVGEIAHTCEVVQGQIPPDIEGTLLRNGPALWERETSKGGKHKKQFLDGDGMVSTVAIKDSKAFFRNRFVRTDSFKKEQDAGRYLDMSIFTKEDPRDGNAFWNRLWKDMINGPPEPKDNAAYNVVHWAGSLCAVSYKRPWKLDTDNLKTIGRGKDTFSSLDYTAHYRPLREPGSSDAVHMVTMDPKTDWANNTSSYTFREIDQDGKLVKTSGPFVMEAGYNHDLIVTDNWYILFDSPVKMDYWRVLWGYPMQEESLGGTTKTDTSRMPRFRLFPRRGQNNNQVIEIEASRHTYAYHHINGFEEDGKIIFDTCIFDDYDLYFAGTIETDGKTTYPDSKFARFEIDPVAGTCSDRILDKTPFEFPMINENFHGKPYQYSFQVGVGYKDSSGVYGPLQTLMKVSMDSTSKDSTKKDIDFWHPGVNRFCHEPSLVQKEGTTDEDDVWVLTVVYDAAEESSYLAILDGKDFSKGAVATVKLPTLIPYGVHGSWTNEYICGEPNS